MKTGSLSCGAWTALLMFAASPVLGQRVQFPSAIPMNTAPATNQGTGYGQAPGYGTATPPSSG